MPRMAPAPPRAIGEAAALLGRLLEGVVAALQKETELLHKLLQTNRSQHSCARYFRKLQQVHQLLRDLQALHRSASTEQQQGGMSTTEGEKDRRGRKRPLGETGSRHSVEEWNSLRELHNSLNYAGDSDLSSFPSLYAPS